MTDPPACGYCGHPDHDHTAGRCWSDTLALGAGRRPCACTTYRHPEGTEP